jgi:hypothetical protein
MRNRNLDLPACSILPQPTTLPRARKVIMTKLNEGLKKSIRRTDHSARCLIQIEISSLRTSDTVPYISKRAEMCA